jgi:hypothetical protein
VPTPEKLIAPAVRSRTVGCRRREKSMLQAFVFEHVAVVVFPWYEPIDPPERGARVEVRLLAPEAHRGSYAAAQRVVIDRPVLRADLFDQTTHPAGNLRSAHFHSHFDGVEPTDRLWPDQIKADPTGWLKDELGDLGRILTRAGAKGADDAVVARDADAVRDAVPVIVAAVEATWDAVRSTPV